MHRSFRISAFFLVVGVGWLAQHADGRPGARIGGRTAWDAELASLHRRLGPLTSDFDKTSFLREYTGGLIDVGRPDDSEARLYRSVDFRSFDTPAFFPRFRDDQLPAECGITTFFYIKLLQAFGFSAYQYSFGFRDAPHERFIHSVTLVRVNVGGADRLIVQDPYLDLTFRTRGGEPMDFFDLLSALEQRAYERIVVDASSVATSLLVTDPAPYYQRLDGPCRALMSAALRRADGTRATRIPITRDYATLMRSPCDPFETGFVAAMRQHGIQEPFLYAYTLRAADLVGAPDHADLQRRIDAALRRSRVAERR